MTRKINGSIKLFPQASDVPTPVKGTIYFNSVINKPRYFDGTAWVDLGFNPGDGVFWINGDRIVYDDWGLRTITNIDGTAVTITVDTVSAHGLVATDSVVIYGTTNYNGTYVVATTPTGTQFTIADVSHDFAAETSGSMYKNAVNPLKWTTGAGISLVNSTSAGGTGSVPPELNIQASGNSSNSTTTLALPHDKNFYHFKWNANTSRIGGSSSNNGSTSVSITINGVPFTLWSTGWRATQFPGRNGDCTIVKTSSNNFDVYSSGRKEGSVTTTAMQIQITGAIGSASGETDQINLQVDDVVYSNN